MCSALHLGHQLLPNSLLNGILFIFLIFSSAIRCDTNQTTSSSDLAGPEYETKYINDFLNYTKQSSETDYEDYDLAKALNEEVMAVAASDDVITSKSGEGKGSILTAILASQTNDLYPDPDLLAEKLWLATQNISGTQDLDRLASASGEAGDGDVRYSDCIYPSDRGHDFIDSIMYIYHGTAGNGTIRNDLGGYILVIGSVFAFAAQLLTIIVLWLKNRRLRRSNAFYPIVINFLVMLILSNFFFIIGVQASKNRIKCEMVAILLHYLHLTTALWCLIYIYIIFDVLTNECGFKLKYNYLLAYGAPAVYVMFSYAASNDTFETHKYCWMSTKKGMIFNFMIPISFLIIVTTVFGTLCIKAIIAKQREIFCESIESITAGAGPTGGPGVTANGNAGNNGGGPTERLGVGLGNFGLCIYGNGVNESMYFTTQSHMQLEKCCSDAEKSYDDFRKTDCYDSKFDLGALSLADLSIQSSSDVQDFSDFKRAAKFAIFFQPMFAICWFLGVVALDNIDSCIFPAIFAICFNILNWCILVRASSVCPFIHLISDDYGDNGGTDTIITDTNHLDDTNPPLKFDTIPLLCATKNLNNNNNNHINISGSIVGLGLSGGSMDGDEEEGIIGIIDIDTNDAPDSVVVVDQQTTIGSKLSEQLFNVNTQPLSFMANSETFHKSWDCNLEKSVIASDCISTIST